MRNITLHFLLLASPYTWLTEHTPREAWLGGFKKDGENFSTLDGLKTILQPHFQLLNAPVEVPFVIRETRRLEPRAEEAVPGLRARAQLARQRLGRGEVARRVDGPERAGGDVPLEPGARVLGAVVRSMRGDRGQTGSEHECGSPHVTPDGQGASPIS